MRSLLTNILLCWIFPSVYALITPPPQNILKCDSLFKNYFRAYGFINIYKGHYGCNLYFLYKPGEMSLDKDATWGQSPSSFKVNPLDKSPWMIFRCPLICPEEFLITSILVTCLNESLQEHENGIFSNCAFCNRRGCILGFCPNNKRTEMLEALLPPPQKKAKKKKKFNYQISL